MADAPQTTGVGLWLATAARRVADRLDPQFQKRERARQGVTAARVYRRDGAGQGSAQGSMRSLADAAFAASPHLVAVVVVERAGIGQVDVIPLGGEPGSSLVDALDMVRPVGMRLEYVEAIDA